MQEEVFCGRGSACPPWENESCVPFSSKNECMEKEYFESIFTSCCPNSEGLVRVSKLLDVFRELRKDVENDSVGICSGAPEPVEALKFMLDPSNIDPLISSAEFFKCVLRCVGSDTTTTPPSSIGGSVPCSPSSQGYSNGGGGDLGLTRKVSELEFQVYKFTELNVDLSEQLAAIEEEKNTLSSKLNILEKSHSQCQSNNERLTKVCQDLEDAKGIMQDYQTIIANLRLRSHQLERENEDMIAVKNISIQETESLVMQLQHATAVISSKNDDLDKLKSKLKIMETERTNFELIKAQTQKQIEELENRNASLQTAINQLSSEKKHLEGMLIAVNAKLDEKSKHEQTKDTDSQSQTLDILSDIETDDNEDSKHPEGIGSNDSYVEHNISTASTSSSFKNSLHSEFKTIREDLWGPEFIGNDIFTFQPTVQLIRKIKHDFKKKLNTDAKKEVNSNALMTVDDSEFYGDNIIIVNKELSELHEELNLMDIFTANKKPSTSDAFTISPFNETLTTSTQTDSKVKGFGMTRSCKKKVLMLLMVTTLLFGIKEIIRGMKNNCSPFIFDHGSLLHNERPII